ncbi:hypothetical protein DPX16_22915 [Anabarilius grahami]|uniref:Uncharacterized protein n=1 Tax=Anabarilius grahami TaxID=495550 RepID=A0A3N0YGD1_ANAGA|nr:hypothetical protein DPX16_22915 [Anabarilius grahami]
MSSFKHTVCDYSDSDVDFVPPSPLPVRRSTRIQCRDLSWVQWSSEKINSTLQAAGIPISQGLSREDLLLLAHNALGSPPSTDDSAPSGQTKQAGRKRSAKSSSPHPAKKPMLSAPTSSPPTFTEPVDANIQLIQVVQSLSETVKGLESKVSKFENAFANSNFSTSSLPPSFHPLVGSSFPSCVPSTSSDLPASHRLIQTPFQDASAPSATSNFTLSTAVPAQEFGRRFVSPAAVTVSSQLRSNIIQGKDINLASLLLPSPAVDRQTVDCGDVAVFLKTSDPRLQRNLSFAEFVIAFRIYRDILCKVFPDRREELDLYLTMMADFNQR